MRVTQNLVKFLFELFDSVTINIIYWEFIPNVTNLVSEEISSQAGVVAFQFYFHPLFLVWLLLRVNKLL